MTRWFRDKSAPRDTIQIKLKNATQKEMLQGDASNFQNVKHDIIPGYSAASQ